MSDTKYTIRLHPKRALKILLGITFALVILNVIALYLRFFPERYTVYSAMHEFFLDVFISQFTLNSEKNIPTFFSSFLLFAASALFFIIASWKKAQRDKYRVHWKILAFLLLLFSIDEFTSLHEKLIKPFRDLPDFNGLFYFKWVIPGLAFVFIFGLAYFMFFLHLERRYKILFLLSAALFFGGALGFEIIGGRFANYNGLKNFTFYMIATVEEMLELGGISLLVYSLLHYMETYIPDLRFLASKTSRSVEP